jgi:nucleotide-binding universal stress UspA family protein
MTESPVRLRILLATDLSARCDRALASAEVALVVLGSQGRSGLARALLGSTAENLLHTLDCDTLVVRGP